MPRSPTNTSRCAARSRDIAVPDPTRQMGPDGKPVNLIAQGALVAHRLGEQASNYLRQKADQLGLNDLSKAAAGALDAEAERSGIGPVTEGAIQAAPAALAAGMGLNLAAQAATNPVMAGAYLGARWQDWRNKNIVPKLPSQNEQDLVRQQVADELFPGTPRENLSSQQQIQLQIEAANRIQDMRHAARGATDMAYRGVVDPVIDMLRPYYPVQADALDAAAQASFPGTYDSTWVDADSRDVGVQAAVASFVETLGNTVMGLYFAVRPSDVKNLPVEYQTGQKPLVPSLNLKGTTGKGNFWGNLGGDIAAMYGAFTDPTIPANVIGMQYAADARAIEANRLRAAAAPGGTYKGKTYDEWYQAQLDANNKYMLYNALARGTCGHRRCVWRDDGCGHGDSQTHQRACRRIGGDIVCRQHRNDYD